MKPPRGYEALRRNRATIVDASYFVTVCTRDRRCGLNEGEPAEAVERELTSMSKDCSIVSRAWVIMPDHLHLFLTATSRLTVGQAIGRLKAKTRTALIARGLAWQGNYYEHRLRLEDAVEDVLRYIYLNPYRANLAARSDTYPHFWICTEDTTWFDRTLDNEHPFPEWLQPSKRAL